MRSSNITPQLPTSWRSGPAVWLVLAMGVLLLSAVFRLVALSDVPPGLHQDEVLDADIAQFIRSGEHALFFRHGYGHEPLYHYLASPFAPLVGDNVLAIRLPSVYLGLLLVALAMRFGKRHYGATAGLVAGLGLAISWWPVIFSRLGIRPILAPLLLLVAAWFWPLRAGRLTRRGLLMAGLAGVWLGLATYSYTAARVAPLIPLLLAGVMGLRYALERRAPSGIAARAQAIYALVVLSLFLVTYAPLGITLQRHPELEQRLEQLGGPLAALRGGDPQAVIQSTLTTLGVFSFTGDPRPTYGLPGRPLFDRLTGTLFYLGLAIAVARWRRPAHALLPVWLAVGLLPSALSPDAPSTVRLVAAMPAVYLLPGLAVDQIMVWFGRPTGAGQSGRWWRRAVIAILVLMLVLIGLRTVVDGFVRWPAELETRLRYQTTLRDIGRQWQAEGDAPPVVVEVFYEPIDAASLRRTLGGDPSARWAQSGGGVDGALVWPAGQDAPGVYVPEYAPLAAGLLAAAGAGEAAYRSPDAPSFAIYRLPDAPAAALMPQTTTFGEPPQMALSGLTEPAVEDGSLHLFTWWDVLSPLPSDLAIFVHLVDESGAVVAQRDGLDAAAESLHVGDRILQRHILPLPPDLSGTYRLQLGTYRRSDGARLPLVDGGDVLNLAGCVANSGDLDCHLTPGK